MKTYRLVYTYNNGYRCSCCRLVWSGEVEFEAENDTAALAIAQEKFTEKKINHYKNDKMEEVNLNRIFCQESRATTRELFEGVKINKIAEFALEEFKIEQEKEENIKSLRKRALEIKRILDPKNLEELRVELEKIEREI